jgi:hypothetical protein
MDNEQYLIEVADAVAAKVISNFDNLPKNGKPLQSQFTVLSG